ncbi:cytochrome c-type biogenesis protein CcmH [Pseudomonas sp. LS44]|uniref:cytochrome c-type biogenesis protein n=1 Tax=Pseudomonas sp. LS44 TaxID=1357074 RepID=UPI00215A7F4E|nr:cytochrome c-type biogenesis protein [Pseudomonas sp. LS44]UVE16337.1 cytochrome c-type biogenesis protein CcmH [Pseudomonas sp. LS44]
MKRLLAAAALGLSLLGVAQAAIDTYEFANDAQRERFTQLTKELRCPKCQNQDIADSNAPIAADLRREIHRMLGEGQSDEQIVEFMVDRYGDFVRYKPAVNARTWLLWYGPFVLLGGGLLVLGVIVLRRRGSTASASTELSADERARLDSLLKSTPADKTTND